MAYCKNCGVEVIGQFCAECGTSKGIGNNFCGECGGKNDKPDWKFCVHCGEKNAVAAAPSNACSCGQPYLPNSRFCGGCGEPRPGLGNSGGIDAGPAPGLPKRRVAPPPPIPGRTNNGLNTSNDGLKTSPRGNANGWNQQQAPTQTVEVSAPQAWSPPRSAPTPINTNSTSSYNTAPVASSPVYNSAPSQFAIPTPPPQPIKEEKKKKSLKDKLKAKLVGGGWLIDKNAPPKTSTPASESPKSPKQQLSTSPSSGGKDTTTNRILEHIQKNYNEPSPSTSPQMSTSPRNPSALNSSFPPSRPAATPVVNNTAPPPPPTRPTVTPAVATNTTPPPPPSKPTAAPTPAKPKEELIPKKEGDVVLVASSFGKQPTAKPMQKVNVPAPPPGIKNKDNRMSLNTILAESTNYDGSPYQATILSHEDRADAVDTSKKVTLYKIAVAQGGKNWAVFRRVAQFEELDKRLKKKNALGPNEGGLKKKAKDKDQMLQDLEKYLVYLLSKPETAGHHYVHNFLQPTQLGDVKPT